MLRCWVANPVGTVTGQKYPDSLIRPDKHEFQPRIGIAWRPFFGSSVLVRASYGIYYNTSVYQSFANQMSTAIAVLKSLHRGEQPRDAADAGRWL